MSRVSWAGKDALVLFLMFDEDEMARRTFTVDGKFFKTQKELLAYVKQEIHGVYPDHTDISSDHLRFMIGLLQHHPWGSQKIGVGVRRMWLQKVGDYKHPCFWLERTDGTKTDFSFRTCVQPPSILGDFKKACRHAVACRVIAFRNAYFAEHANDGKVACQMTGEWIGVHESHVDHAPPMTFDAIVNEFISSIGDNVENAPLSDHSDGNIGCEFTDDMFIAKWIKFHDARASLRILSVEANLSLAKIEWNPSE